MEYTKGLKDTIVKALHAVGYTTFKAVQEKCIPLLLEGKQVAVQAETGSGKTAAYLVPALQEIDDTCSDTQVLIIAPTRELAIQIGDTAAKLSAYTKIHSIVLIGGLEVRKQINALKHRPHLLIGTPGRLLDLIQQDAIDLSHLKTVVMDEADQLISTGQREETNQILKYCHCRYALFSATLTDDVRKFIKGDYIDVLLHDANITQRVEPYWIQTSNKTEALLTLLKHTNISSCIVFVNHKSTASELAVLLHKKHILVHAFSSAYAEKKRIEIMKDFKQGNYRVLIATDAAARGLDITGISHIIHYELPIDKETFVHRSGRTGHQEESGITITILNDEDLQTTLGHMIFTSYQRYIWDKDTSYDLSTPLIKHKEKRPKTFSLTIYAGRKDKIRPKDVIGALCTMIPFEKIGPLEIQDTYSTVVLSELPETKLDRIRIKGKDRKVVIRKDR